MFGLSGVLYVICGSFWSVFRSFAQTFLVTRDLPHTKNEFCSVELKDLMLTKDIPLWLRDQ